jgi:peptidyl-prolyl cis-trans isomerase B (cyclophilin B)
LFGFVDGGKVAKQDKLSKAAAERIRNYEVKTVAENDTKATRKRDNRVSIFVSLAAVIVAFGSQIAYQSLAPVPTSTPTPTPSASKTASGNVPDASIAEGREWAGQMTLNSTPMNFVLDGKNAPQASANFISLVRSGFYEGVTCHRLTTAGIYVLQCGDPDATGAGGPGYSFGPIENAPADDNYGAGVLAMARVGGNANSQGSQFFIVYSNSMIPSDTVGGYTVFGRLTDGLQGVLDVAAKGVSGGGSDGKPNSPAVLTDVSVK